jgi:hypothetical protein
MPWYTIFCDDEIYLDGNITEREANRYFDIALNYEICKKVSLFKGKEIGRLIRTEKGTKAGNDSET